MQMLIHEIFEALDKHGVRYCHWKSNINISDVVSGETDIDLLVDRRCADTFQAIVHQFRFKRAKQSFLGGSPSVFHYFCMDTASGSIIHLHVYYRIVTGGSLLKNYRLPLDEILLSGSHRIEGIRVPDKSAELAVFVLRKTLEYGAIGEIALLHREWSAVMRELAWLTGDETVEEAERLLTYWLPALEKGIFRKCLAALSGKGTFILKIKLARQVQNSLENYRIHGPFIASSIRTINAALKVGRKLTTKRKDKYLSTGGAVIAIVGPEATGKTTLHGEVCRMLGEHLDVISVHAGKPPSTWLTFIPNLFMPFLRQILPRYRSLAVEDDFQSNGDNKTKKLGFLRQAAFIVRSLMVAHDRTALLKRMHKLAVQGSIVVSDRYPSYIAGAMDSGQLDTGVEQDSKLGWQRYFIYLESRMYRKIPPPDIVVRLTVPVEIAVQRNAVRIKKGVEDESYVRRRHRQSEKQEYISPYTFTIDTSAPLAETTIQIKRIIWDCL